MKKTVTPIAMFLFGIISFAAIMIASHKLKINIEDDSFWPYRVLTALATASISISIPGMLKVNYVAKEDENSVRTFEKVNNFSLLDKEPTLSASGAIAVFVLVYLFNPLF